MYYYLRYEGTYEIALSSQLTLRHTRFYFPVSRWPNFLLSYHTRVGKTNDDEDDETSQAFIISTYLLTHVISTLIMGDIDWMD